MQTKKTFKKVLGGGLAAATLAGAGIAAAAPAQASNVWDRLAECESNGNWSINTGNGYYGGLQFSLQSWQAVGGTGYPHEASKEEQINRAQQLHAIQGWGAWPSCSAQLGLYGESPNAGATGSGENTGGAAAEQPAEQAPQQEETQQQEPAPQPEPEPEPAPEPTQEAPQQEAPAEEPVPAPASQSAAPNTDVEVSDETYSIQSGDSLSKIANELGIDDWQDLWGANADEIEDPNVIFVGQELKLPVL